MPNASIVFVDTNVLLYGFDERDPVKRGRAQVWLKWCWERQAGRVSIQVVNEFYANALKKFSRSLTVKLARAEVRNLRAWQPWKIDDDTVDSAWQLQDRYALSYWDALIIAAAQQTGCTHLLTEDLQHDQRIEKLTLVNPFMALPADIEN